MAERIEEKRTDLLNETQVYIEGLGQGSVVYALPIGHEADLVRFRKDHGDYFAAVRRTGNVVVIKSEDLLKHQT